MRFHNWIAAFVLNLLVCVGAFAAQITGTVTNATTNKPSSGDEVVLLSLANGMDEVAKTKSDSQGHFTLNVPDEGAQHLVRVTRQSVNYFKAVPPGTAMVDTTVYDASTQVEGLVTEARVFRLQASGGSMDVQESYVLNNQSQPPRSKIGNQTFAITLPDGAGVSEASLTGPSGMPVTVAAVPSGGKNRYAYDFPIRPGQTRFEVTYKLPYSGSYEFSLKPEAQLNELGVLLPKSMKFAGVSGGFVQDVDEAGLAVFFAKNVPANQEVKFSVGSIQSASAGISGALWFIVGAIVILIGGGAFVMWRKRGGAKAVSKPKAARAASKARAQAQSQGAKPRQGDMLDVLKDELFQLENDRLNGKVSQEEYEKSKAGLDTLFRRQMKNR
ncbi:MAG TPA: hypothetical protein VGQ12_12065 [Candidatus Angelobacter sp.]|nr:hypothetical protein [Candidatus Angelobacter sp.]